jgi:hypothetical protein
MTKEARTLLVKVLGGEATQILMKELEREGFEIVKR